MPRFRDDRILPFSPQQLYDLVIDIEKYPDFLPWCVKANILDRPNKNTLYASVSAGYKLYSASYISKVTFTENDTIDAEYIEGPFKHLKNHWRFIPHDKGCDLRFYVEFEFSNGLFNTVANHLLIEITEKMVEAFIQRAHEMYPSQKD